MFETNPKDLRSLLSDAHEGKLQLPDFQRSYVWSDEDVKSLIGSIARGFPVGALLTLSAGGEVNFAPRLIEGASGGEQIEQLLLDGQQRITSLYGALYSKMPMKTRPRRDARKTVQRFYFLDIAQAVADAENIEAAVLGVSADRTLPEGLHAIRHDFSTPAKQFDALAFPLNIVFQPMETMSWIMACQTHHAGNTEKAALLNRFVKDVLATLSGYKMPVIKLDRTSSREAICLIFEKVNVGGKKLDAFELVTAIFAGQKDPLDLRADWWGKGAIPGRQKAIIGGKDGKGNRNLALTGIANTDFLQAVSLLHTQAVRTAHAGPGDPPQISCKREALLALPLSAYRAYADKVEEGFRQAGIFLNEQRVLWTKDVPYPAQIVTIASVMAALGSRSLTIPAKQKLATWFWRVALSEDFGSSTESKIAKDFPDLIRWIEADIVPQRLDLLGFNAVRLDTLTSRLSAAYKALSALLLREGCRDFMSGSPAEVASFHSQPLDIHHIFPQNWCRKQGGDAARLMDSIVNKTPISAAANRSIGGAAPSAYLPKVARKASMTSPELDDVLTSHLISPALLRADAFDRFFEDRKLKLCAIIEKAIGKPVTNLPQKEEPADDLPSDELEPEDRFQETEAA